MSGIRPKTKEEFVHELFSSIACRYDFLNSFLSFNQDRYWRRFAVSKTRLRAGGIGLDVGCGTGLLTIELSRFAGTGGKVVGLDFCSEMLDIAVSNIARTSWRPIIELVEANAMELPFPDNYFDCATSGFALRNVSDIKTVLSEMRRVVKPGGTVVLLELAKPSMPVFKQLYYWYFEKILPFLGKLGTGISGPYDWLPESLRLFPHQEELSRLLQEIGLNDVQCDELTGGIVAVHSGVK